VITVRKSGISGGFLFPEEAAAGVLGYRGRDPHTHTLALFTHRHNPDAAAAPKSEGQMYSRSFSERSDAMLNSKALRGLCALLLCCAPALAIIPPEVGIRMSGAYLVGENHYVVHEKTVVTVAVDALPRDTIGLFAMALDEFGRPDKSTILPLFIVEGSDGSEVADIWIAPGLGGKSFLVGALATNGDGTLRASALLIVDVKGTSDPPQNDPTDPADDG
jgi:hypothetical protein